MLYRRGSDRLTERGFTLPELLASIAIVGVISSVAVPMQLNQVEKARQNEVTATIAQIQTTIASYADEFGTLPTSWKELNSTSAIMTTNGPANQNDFEPIALASGHYEAEIINTDNRFTIVAIQPKTQDISSGACLPDFETPDLPGCQPINRKSCITEFSTNPNPTITQQMCGRLPIAACINLTNGASNIHKIKGFGQVLSPNCG
ncbi:prepilin-type N-terminal cleavage/methylation domain-containing protein [bacterium]|nr:prepilin-type N-terminal cleavage/methylation domain-containing protein [bacterium]